jgi:Carboxypeptidase regulatory-like domain
MKRNPLLGLGLVALVLVATMLWRSSKTGPTSGPEPAQAARPSTGPLRARQDLRAIPLQLDGDPRGELRLKGLVLDSEDLPAEGARVTIDTTPPRSIETDTEGAFFFENLAPRAYVVEARSEEEVAGPTGVQLNADFAPITLRMRRAASLAVTVVDRSQRRGIAEAVVALRGTSDLEAACDADGRAELRGVPAGPYVLKASAPGYAPVWRSYVAPDSAGTVDELRIELGSGSPVSGRVVDERGEAVAGASVQVEDGSSLVPMTDASRDVVVTDASGSWTFPALQGGTYRFIARSESRAPGTSALVQIDGQNPREGVLIKLPESARILGRVTTWTGEPVGYATVRAVVDEGSFGQVLARQTLCDKEGQFHVEGLPRRRVSVVALSDGKSSLTQSFDLAETPERSGVIIALDADGSIAGVVRMASGEPVPDALVLAESAAAASRTRAELTLRGEISGVAGAGGRFELQGLRPGKYLLRASWPGTSLARRASWLRAGVAAQTGSRDVILTLEADGVIRGQVQKQDGSTPERLTVTLGGGLSFAGASGRFVLSDVPSGSHVLTVSGADFVTRTLQGIEVKPGEEEDLGVIQVEGGRRIGGRVLRGDGTAVAGATVSASKQIAGVVAGPGGAMVADMKQVISGEDGTFALDGLGSFPLSVGAEHPSAGKSDFLTVPPGAQNLHIDLTLRSVGSLKGVVTRRGEPVGGAVIAVSAKGAPAGGSGVTTGTDGSYQFDSLTPGAYSLIAMFDNGGGPQMKQASVTVKPGEAVAYNVDLPGGEVTLVIAAALPAPGETVVDTAQVFLAATGVSGGVTLDGGLPGSGGEDVRSQLLTRTEPVRFGELAPGSYQLCLAPRSPLQGGAARADNAEPPAKQPTPYCRYIGIEERPAEQQISVKMPAN